MLFEFLNHSQALNKAEITETLITAELKITIDENAESFILKLFDELKTISPRDSYELFIEADGEHVSITDHLQLSLLKLQNHISNHSDQNVFEVQLIIEKTAVDGIISIYYIESFANYLGREKSFNLILNFSKLFTDKLNFEVFSSTTEFGSADIRFFEAGSKDVIQKISESKHLREEKLELFLENAISSNIPLKLLPTDFNLTLVSQYSEINNFFNVACTILSFAFIANTSELNDHNEFSYKICGYKTISCKSLNFETYTLKFKLLLKIYAWTYEGGNNSDKLGLVRNVISIHLDSLGEALFDEDVWSAIQSNYQIYLKGNIQSYLDVKNKIGELILESTAKTYSLVDDLLDSLKNNAFILLSFILTVVVINGLKDTNEAVVFSNQYVVILGILSTVSAIWLMMTRIEVFRRYDNASSNVSEVLKLNYSKIIMHSEIDDLINPIIAKNRSYLKSQANRYTWWWATMLAFVMMGFFIGNSLFTSNGFLKTKLESKSSVILHQADNPNKQPVKPNVDSTKNTSSSKLKDKI